jgi:SOS-response transcriptional repressor LexA
VTSPWKGQRELCPFCKGLGLRLRPATLTKRQAEVYRYLWSYVAAHGYAPTLQEISAAFGFNSDGTTHEHLSNLERKGYLARSYNETRAMELLVPVDELGVLKLEMPSESAPV